MAPNARRPGARAWAAHWRPGRAAGRTQFQTGLVCDAVRRTVPGRARYGSAAGRSRASGPGRGRRPLLARRTPGRRHRPGHGRGVVGPACPPRRAHRSGFPPPPAPGGAGPRDDHVRPRQRRAGHLGFHGSVHRGHGRSSRPVPGDVDGWGRGGDGPALPGGRRHQPTTAREGGRSPDRPRSDRWRGAAPPAAVLALCDLVLVPAGAAPPGAVPPGVEVCEIRGA